MHTLSTTDYRELPGRRHAMLGQSTWPEDAELVQRWLAVLHQSR